MCLYFLAILVPFLPVFFKTGCSCDLLINILLCCLGWIPGVIRKLDSHRCEIRTLIYSQRCLVCNWTARPSQISIDHQDVESRGNGFHSRLDLI
ncbi:hypothetical protein BKA61DRAFT_242744 [Leptodontidium sp. MPI-SDFR-AT-0119]|nr:hypothetical protein BKA61DRAFT_242744 [Leptodontidium sp. MPI-SDFR-AT-0119]